MRVAVIGASGYTGMELLRIIQRHPHLELAAVTSEQRAGQVVGEAFPAMRGLIDLEFEALDGADLAKRAEAAFVCLPHATAAPVVEALRAGGVTVVDISADFRFRDRDVYEAWYGPHKAADLFGKAVYGMPEVYRDALVGAELIAAPGCYPTSALLPMLPFLRARVVAPGTIFVDGKSGASGAGRAAGEAFQLTELDGNAYAYKVAAHRHGPEMEQEASAGAGRPVQVTFVPHILPTIRGIISTCYMNAEPGLTTAAAREILVAAYADAPFVRVLPEGETPKLAHVRGSNFCDVGVVVDEHAGSLIALGAIDNLVKGAVGQGVQCLNVAQGWSETAGLEEAPFSP